MPDHRLFPWWVLLLVEVRQRRKIFCALFGMLVAVCSPGTMSLSRHIERIFSARNPSERDVILLPVTVRC